MASEQGSCWIIERPIIFHLCVVLYKIYVNLVFKHINVVSFQYIIIQSILLSKSESLKLTRQLTVHDVCITLEL